MNSLTFLTFTHRPIFSVHTIRRQLTADKLRIDTNWRLDDLTDFRLSTIDRGLRLFEEWLPIDLEAAEPTSETRATQTYWG